MDLLIVPYKLGKKQGYRTELKGIPFSRKPVELKRAIQQAEALEDRMPEIESYSLSEDDIQKMIPNVISRNRIIFSF